MKKKIAPFAFIGMYAVFISPVSGTDISQKSTALDSIVVLEKTDTARFIRKDSLAIKSISGNPKTDSLQKKSLPSSLQPTMTHEDSAAKTAVKDSLLLEKSSNLARYKKFPVSIDSLYSPNRLDQSYLFSSDAVGLSEAMRAYQQVISVPFSLSSALNRFMVYGFPLPSPTLYSDESLLGENANGLKGSDDITSMQVSQVRLEPPLQVRYDQHPGKLVTPETDLFWEHGVFSENIFCVRFTRPLSQNLDVGIFSNNRLFSPLTYETRGDIETFYNYFVHDTTLLSQGGKYPLVNEQNSGARLVSKGKNGQRLYLSLRYNDLRNEESFESQDSSGRKSLAWENIFQYGTFADAGISGIRIRPFVLTVESHLVTEGHTRNVPLINKELLGRHNEYSLAVKPLAPLFSDTLALSGALVLHDQTLYDDSKPASMSADGAITYVHGFSPLKGMDARVTGTVGQHYLNFEGGRHGHDWTWGINARIESSSGMLHVYSLHDFASYPIMYDTTDRPFNKFFDSYDAHGAELFAWYGKIGVTTGVCALSGLGGEDSLEIWPHNMLPYQQPRLSYVIAPLFGQWHGFSAASRWMFSDKKPFIKSQTSLSYRVHPLNWKEHILLDLVLDYWGARDTLTYGGSNDWNREIYNLYFKSAVQIKTFSLFYKIDNFLNRNFTYVPGYRMPGITFRWGFQWLIQG